MQLFVFTHTAMGCEFKLALEAHAEQAAHDTAVEVWEDIDRLDRQISHYRKDSDISRINALAADEPVLVEPRLFQLLMFARDMWMLTNGTLDITMGPLSRAWGFFSGDMAEPPPGAIDSARELCGFHHVTIDPDQRLIAFDRPGVQIDLAALGKGYAIDRAVDLLRDRNVPSAILSAGGSSSFAYGGDWQVRLPSGATSTLHSSEGNPHPSLPLWKRGREEMHSRDDDRAEVALSNQGMSTSGPSEQSLYVRGERRSHLIDPSTGEPSKSSVTATVVAPTALEAEALSTPIALRGVETPDWLHGLLTRTADIAVYLCVDQA